ncbi:MAG: right-handed parallel beta-helix repeat-containing protein [bacterium]|nr:right-handed parallel beta-helix repeat-containing protein [bacterium]
MKSVRALAQVAALTLAALILAATAHAAYTTPGSGVDWTLDDLVAASAGAVTGGGSSYAVNDAVIIAVGDRVTIAAGTTLQFFGGNTVGIEVNGSLAAVGTESQPIIFTATAATPGAWRGLDFEDTALGSAFHLAWCEIGYADIGVDVFGADILVEDSTIHHCSNRALDFSTANGSVLRCTIRDNQTRTITATLTSSPLIEGCLFENNNIQNTSPYPYINVGLQGVNSPIIRGCHIIGSGHHMSGGISIWAASSATIDNNTIEGCGYGILCYSTGANPVIRSNRIWDNTIHPDQVNWGFGVACNGNNAPILTGNRIYGHWYGVAAINGGRPNLGNQDNGSDEDDGGNFIVLNALNGQSYGFYNNTPFPQMAQGNFWGYASAGADVEPHIYHQVDDPALGLVDFAYHIPTITAAPDPTPSVMLGRGSVYPNPFNPQTTIRFQLPTAGRAQLQIFDLAGRLVRTLVDDNLDAGGHEAVWDGRDAAGRDVGSGSYLARLECGGKVETARLGLVR